MKKTRSKRRTTGESNLETGASFLVMELETGERSPQGTNQIGTIPVTANGKGIWVSVKKGDLPMTRK
jgi:hypothetical protein